MLNKAKMNILTKCWTYVALKDEYEFLFKPGIQLVKDRDSNRRGFNLDLPDAFSIEDNIQIPKKSVRLQIIAQQLLSFPFSDLTKKIIQ